MIKCHTILDDKSKDNSSILMKMKVIKWYYGLDNSEQIDIETKIADLDNNDEKKIRPKMKKVIHQKI